MAKQRVVDLERLAADEDRALHAPGRVVRAAVSELLDKDGALVFLQRMLAA